MDSLADLFRCLQVLQDKVLTVLEVGYTRHLFSSLHIHRSYIAKNQYILKLRDEAAKSVSAAMTAHSESCEASVHFNMQ
jgi:hypothetical protein